MLRPAVLYFIEDDEGREHAPPGSPEGGQFVSKGTEHRPPDQWMRDHPDYEADPEQFAREAHAAKGHSRYNRLGAVEGTTASEIERLTGRSAASWHIVVQGQWAHHILKSHENDVRPTTPADFKLAEKIVNEADSITYPKDSKEGHPMLLFEKSIDGVNYRVAAVPLVASRRRSQAQLRVSSLYRK